MASLSPESVGDNCCCQGAASPGMKDPAGAGAGRAGLCPFFSAARLGLEMTKKPCFGRKLYSTPSASNNANQKLHNTSSHETTRFKSDSTRPFFKNGCGHFACTSIPCKYARVKVAQAKSAGMRIQRNGLACTNKASSATSSGRNASCQRMVKMPRHIL